MSLFSQGFQYNCVCCTLFVLLNGQDKSFEDKEKTKPCNRGDKTVNDQDKDFLDHRKDKTLYGQEKAFQDQKVQGLERSRILNVKTLNG